MQKKQHKQTNIKPLFKFISLDVIPHDICIGIGMDYQTLRKRFTKHTGLELSNREVADSTQGSTSAISGGGTLIWLRRHPTTPETIAYLAHEATHAVHFVFSHHGIEYNPHENDEMLAYGVQFLVKTVLNLYN